MFTASKRIRTERTNHGRKTTAMIIATLVFANVIAIVGLGATAHAGSFPDALQYAPMTWANELPALPDAPAANPQPTVQTVTVAPVERHAIPEVEGPLAAYRKFAEVRTPAFVQPKSADHRYLLIALMTLALGTMAAVSVHMFRSLAREISEVERSRGSRF